MWEVRYIRILYVFRLIHILGYVHLWFLILINVKVVHKCNLTRWDAYVFPFLWIRFCLLMNCISNTIKRRNYLICRFCDTKVKFLRMWHGFISPISIIQRASPHLINNILYYVCFYKSFLVRMNLINKLYMMSFIIYQSKREKILEMTYKNWFLSKNA